jgi:hypothetical protein
MVSPSAWAVLRLITSSNEVGCSIGQVRGLGTFQDLVDVGGGAAEFVTKIGPIGQQRPGLRRQRAPQDRRQSALGHEAQEPRVVRRKERRGDHQERLRALAGHGGEGALQVLGLVDMQEVQGHPQGAGRLL